VQELIAFLKDAESRIRFSTNLVGRDLQHLRSKVAPQPDRSRRGRGNISRRADKSYCTKKIVKLLLRELARSWQPDIASIGDMKLLPTTCAASLTSDSYFAAAWAQTQCSSAEVSRDALRMREACTLGSMIEALPSR